MASMTARTDKDEAPRRYKERHPYADVGRAMRQAIDRALADPKVPAGHLRVLLVVLADVASWSRLDEATTRADLARRAGVSEETVKRAMPRLQALGAVVWDPSTTRGRPSHVRLPEAVAVTPTSGHLDDPATAPTAPTTGHPDDPATAPTTGHLDDPPYEEKNFEKTPGYVEEDPLNMEEQIVEDAQIVAVRSARELGCTPERWRNSSRRHRDELVLQLAERLRAGEAPFVLLDGLVARKPPRDGVDQWPHFLLGRLGKLQSVPSERRAWA